MEKENEKLLEEVKKLRANFAQQLEQANKTHAHQANQLANLVKQQDQLKGALFAMDQLKTVIETSKKEEVGKVKEVSDGER